MNFRRSYFLKHVLALFTFFKKHFINPSYKHIYCACLYYVYWVN